MLIRALLTASAGEAVPLGVRPPRWRATRFFTNDQEDEMTNETREQVALFRYRLISPDAVPSQA